MLLQHWQSAKMRLVIGVNRNITLPGGRQIRVRIPAGVKDGQVIRVLDQNDQTGTGSTIKVYLTLSIVSSTSSVAPLLVGEKVAKQDETTTSGRDQNTPMRSGSAVSLKDEKRSTISTGTVLPTGRDAKELQVPLTTVSSSDAENASGFTPKQFPKDPRRRISRVYLSFIALLVALLVVSSAGFFYYLGGRHSTTNATATETAKTHMFQTTTAIARI